MRIVYFLAISSFLSTGRGGAVDKGDANEEDRNKVAGGGSTSPMKKNVVTSSMGDNFGTLQADVDTPQSTRSANVPALSTVTGSATTPIVAQREPTPISTNSKMDDTVTSFGGDNFQQSPGWNEDNASSLTSVEAADVPAVSDDTQESAAMVTNVRPLTESDTTSDVTRTQNTPDLSAAAAAKDLRFPMRAYAKRVSLVSVHEKTGYAADKKAIISTLNFDLRRKLCDVTLDGYEMKNGDLDVFIFDSHLYEFEFEDGGYQVSVAIHCPTKGFPEVFLRLPEGKDEDLQLVLVRGTHHPVKYFFRFGSALSITLVQEENDATKELRTNPVFGLGLEDRWSLCERAHSVFKYKIREDKKFVGEPAAIYRVKIGEEEQLFAAIRCPFHVPFHLLFNNITREVKTTFGHDIENLIEDRRLSHKPDLIQPLTNIRASKTPSWIDKLLSFFLSRPKKDKGKKV